MAKRKSKIDREGIMAAYMSAVLEENLPGNVYAFSKMLGIEEALFYEYFASLDAIEKSVWSTLMQKSIDTAERDTAGQESDLKDRLLSLYFTFFENC
ncbi:MAG: hypothetical protein KTR24_12345, partial [Saprospiraceae bacterium]|nr:hypothetical protein [Saprospiraceae bacterium]